VFVTSPYRVPSKGLSDIEEQARRCNVAVHLRRKIETFLTVAFARGYDSVIFGPFGDPALQDVYTHTCWAVFSEFYGLFKSLYFAAPDEMSTNIVKSVIASQQLDPTDGQPKIKICNPSELEFTGKSGRICPNQADCKDRDRPHREKYVHLPFCPFGGNCQTEHPLHRCLWDHQIPCPDWSFCTRFADQAHTGRYDHPPRCELWSSCGDISEEHMAEKWHPPVCPFGLEHRVSDPGLSGQCSQLFILVTLLNLVSDDRILSYISRL
jgi:hypothetical protein